MDKAEITSLLTWIYINRQSLHVYPDAPEDVAMVRSRLNYETTEKVMDTVKKSVVFTGESSIYAVMNKPFISLNDFQYYTWLRLPKVTGNFTNGTQSIQLTAFNLQEVLELFKQDLQFIQSPQVLEAITIKADKENWLKRIYALRKVAAKGLASRIMPMFEYSNSSETDLEVHAYVETLLLAFIDKDIDKVLFCKSSGTTNFKGITDHWAYYGDIDNCEDYPLEIQLGESKVSGIGGITSENGIFDMSKSKFITQYLHDTSNNTWLSPMDRNKEYLEFALDSTDVIMLPSADAPSAPILVANEKLNDSWAWTFEVRPLDNDILYIIKNDSKQKVQVEANSAVYTMHDYYEKSLLLQHKNQADERDQLIGYLEQYAEALLSFKDVQRQEEVVQKLTFIKTQGSEQWEKVQLMKPDSNIALQYMIANNEWIEMEKTADAFLFNESNMPAVGMSVRLKMTWIHKSENVNYSLCMVREQILAKQTSLVKNSSFDQWSAEISF